MRGTNEPQSSLWYSINLEDMVEAGHPLRPIKRMVDLALARMSASFSAAYAAGGRPSVPPERLLKALLLQCLYTIRSERELCRRLRTDMLFRWFLDMQPDEATFDPTVFTHNRDRLDSHGLTRKFFDSVVRQAIDAGLTSDEHFTVDGSLIQSHASLKSLKRIEREATESEGPKDEPPRGGPAPKSRRSRNEPVDFKGERRTNDTHRSSTDPEARLYRKGNGVAANLCHSVHALTENRHGLVLAVEVDEANGIAERESALRMVDRVRRRHALAPRTLGADMGFDAGPFLLELESRGIEPHVAIRPGRIKRKDECAEARRRARDRRRLAGYCRSQRKRKLVEEYFGWGKSVGPMRRTRHVGRFKIRQQVELTGAAYNLVRMAKLLRAA